MISHLVLFGASGDLAGRFLLPALATLRATGRLGQDLAIVGTARPPWDDDAFRDHVAERLAEHAADVPPEHRDALTRSLRYRPADLTDANDVARVIRLAGEGPVVAYLALPPGVFGPTVTALGAAGLPPGSRIALEKPFGDNLESAIALNRLLVDVTGVAGEHEVFRVDHFLGLATVQNLLGMRLANRVLEPVWNSAHIEQVEIVWEETLGLEGRAAYYDRAGQLKDMVQNHLLQVLCLVAMEPPASLGERDLRDRKLDVLRSVCPLRPEQMTARTRRARYTAGRLGERDVPDYVD
jgi:glucose-6-phosphate 1-dehydrogenase